MSGSRADGADCSRMNEDRLMEGDDECTGSVGEVERGSSRMKGQGREIKGWRMRD